jgi:hypothetical protein
MRGNQEPEDGDISLPAESIRGRYDNLRLKVVVWYLASALSAVAMTEGVIEYGITRNATERTIALMGMFATFASILGGIKPSIDSDQFRRRNQDELAAPTPQMLLETDQHIEYFEQNDQTKWSEPNDYPNEHPEAD